VREWVDNVSYADNDAVVFGAGLLSTDAIFTRDGDDLTISFAGLPDQVTIFGQFETQAFYAGWRDIETFTFGDSVVLTAADIRVRVLAQASTSGDDVITGFSSVADVINGGAGNDILRGLGGGDVYLFGVGSGQDVIQESIGSLYEDQPDTLRFDATVDREDVTFTRDGADLVITVAGVTDSVRIEGQFGSTGYAAVERFEFHGGLVLTKAEVSLLVLAAQSTPGDDIIVGTGGADVIAGGAGNDILRGGDGADTYYFATGFGSDVIDEEVDNVAISDFDVIEFGPGLLAADAVLSRDGADLLISFPTGDVVRVLRQFDHMAYFAGWEDIEEIRFQAGEVWTQADIRERLLEQASTSGDDVILGYFGADVMDGGAGDDELHGLGGDDIYVFGFGSGHDTVIEAFEVYEGKFDTVAFKAGVLPADVVFTIVGDDLVATLTGGSDSLSIRDFFRSEQHEVEVFTFADGSSLNMAQVASMALAAQTTAGDDIIAGSWRADSLSGGRGDDRLSGGGGGDTYHYAVGDGRDIITDGGDSAGDVITLGAGITTTTINLYRSGSDLVIETVGGDQNAIVVRGHFQGTVNRIEGLVFADGTVWDVAAIAAHLEVLPAGELRGTFADDAVTGTAAAETLIGREGDDVLTGGAGSDVYVYESGDGSDTIVDSSTTASETDVLQLADFAPGDVQMRRVGGDLIITVPGGVITVEDHFTQAGAGRGLERIDFAGGVSWNRADIDAAAWVVGTAGDDTLTVTAGDTVFQGGLGDDTLAGGAGSDTYVYASGDGSDRIQEGYVVGVDRLWLTDLNAADVMLSRVGNDLMVRDLTTNQVIRIDSHFEATGSAEGHGIESLRFGDGVIWDRAAITANSWTSGTTGVDNLSGTAGADNLFGDLGDDILQGGAGGDTYRYRSGDGSDRIQDSSTAGADVLHLVDLNASDIALSRVGADVYVKDLTTGHSIRINEQASGGGAGDGYGIEIIRFADGTEWNRATILANAWVRGTTGADNFGGFGGDDTMFGDLGADRMSGGVGADTYIYRSGDGADIIAEDSGVGADTLHLVDLNVSNVAVSRVGSDLMIQDLSTGQTIKVESHFFTGPTGNGYGVEIIRFADGTEWNRATILSNAWVRGTTGADNLGGSAGDDMMFGGLGADRLAGGVGADTYIYRSGDGADTIADDSSTGADTLHLVDLNPANVAVSRVGSDLMIQDLSTGHTIKVEYHFFTGTTGNGYGVEVIRFADGTEWNRAAIQANAWIRGTTGADNLGGTGGDDTMFGGLGADRIGGGAGADTYIYRSGDGADTIAEDSGVGADTLHLIDLNTSNVAVSRVGSDLMIQDLSTGQSIKVEYHFWSGTTGNGYGIETLKFADGATWTRQQIADAVSGLSAIGLSAKAVVSPLAPPSPSESAGKDAEPLVQPSVSDDFGKGALDPIVCRTDPTEDFVVKSYDDGPLVRPVTDDFAVHGPIVRDMYDGWSLTLPIDWAGGVGVGPSTPHIDDDWLF
jgi:Ca2+-binding RTX toxin-like protein